MHSEPNICHARILVLDRDAAACQQIQAFLTQLGYQDVHAFRHPEEAAGSAATGPADLVLLNPADQTLNRFELLSRLKIKPISDGYLPILVTVSAEDHAERQELLEMGAYDFLTAPVNPVELSIRVRNALQSRWMSRKLNCVADDLEAKVQARTQDLYESQIEILQRLARASEYRDDDTGDHTKRVGSLAALIAEAMGMSQEEVELIRLAAPLHDIGKIGIRDAILLKPGKLTESEYIVMRTHAIIGSRILSGKAPLLQMAEVIARTHHERWDGSGYPSRLAGTDIPLPGRIVAVADVFDALTNARSYKSAWPLGRAVEEIRIQSGKSFDPKVVEAFLKVMASENDLSKAA